MVSIGKKKKKSKQQQQQNRKTKPWSNSHLIQKWVTNLNIDTDNSMVITRAEEWRGEDEEGQILWQKETSLQVTSIQWNI